MSESNDKPKKIMQPLVGKQKPIQRLATSTIRLDKGLKKAPSKPPIKK